MVNDQMVNEFLSLPDGTIVKYCHTPEPLYASEDGEHIYLINPSSNLFREVPQRFKSYKPDKPDYRRKQKYKHVRYWFNGKRFNYSVHRLVACAWHGPHSFPDFECHHLNGITADNRASNLIWLTHQDHLRFDAALRRGLILSVGNEHDDKSIEYEMNHHRES